MKKIICIALLLVMLSLCSCKQPSNNPDVENNDPTKMVDIEYNRKEAPTLELDRKYSAEDSLTGKEAFNMGECCVRGIVTDEYELDISYRFAGSPKDESTSHEIRGILELTVLDVYGKDGGIKTDDKIKLVSQQCSEFQSGFADVEKGGEYIFIIKDYANSSELYAQWPEMKSYADYMVVSPYYMVISKTANDEYDADVFIRLLTDGTYSSKKFEERKMYSLEEVEEVINSNLDELKGLDKPDIFNARISDGAD